MIGVIKFPVLQLFLFLCLLELSLMKDSLKLPKSKVLSRRKRFVTFPEGSSFSMASCMVVGLIGQPAPTTAPGTFTFATNWGIAYELPNITNTVDLVKKKKQMTFISQRRNRRDLYGKLETIIDNMGYNGKQCILKTLCETAQRLVPNGPNMVEEMFRTLFTLPASKVMMLERVEHTIYDEAHRIGAMMENCDSYECPISLVDLAKGYYDATRYEGDGVSNPWSELHRIIV